MATDSNAITIHELLHERCIYQMPLFQREYQWREQSELTHFWDDLVSVLDDEIDVSFLGAVVLQIEKTGTSKSSQVYTVIDGQQRITTFFLMMCAIVATARANGWSETAGDLETQYLVSGLSSEKGRAKLVPTFRDNANFNEVVKSTPGSPIKLLPDTGMHDGPMVLAYGYLLRRIEEFLEGEKGGTAAKTEDRLATLYNALLERMEVVQIILDKAHNANEVFDRLNTAGRPLSTIDLVRNELFQQSQKITIKLKSFIRHAGLPLRSGSMRLWRTTIRRHGAGSLTTSFFHTPSPICPLRRRTSFSLT